MMAMNTLTYYLPFYFQASIALSPRMSGIYILALAVPEGVTSIVCGVVVTVTGVYVPFMIASGIILAVGSGLLTMLNTTSSLVSIIGYQIVASVGFGLGIQLPLTAIRNTLDEVDVPLGNALVVFSQGLGTSLSLSIAQAIFLNTLKSRLEIHFSKEETEQLVKLGAANVNTRHISPELVPIVAAAYNSATRASFYLAIAASLMVVIGSGVMERKRLEKKPKPQG